MRRVHGGHGLSKAPIIHHHPRVRKGKPNRFWWSECPCGHAKHFQRWRLAFIDALVHSQELK
jgi:hypothetical protein